MQQMTHETLDTGLGSFRDSSPDYILAPVGLASMQDQAQKLAEYGRNGDVYIVHAAQGETVIPLEVLNANPKVKGLLYKQMRDMGLDPKEFVVGDELNSINPVTGLPEFFFKKIFRTVKKVVKKVIKVAKKIAPIALPLIAATFGFPFLSPTLFGAGSFGATALAGGLGTLAQGGSFKDALKSGLMAGGIASIGAGFRGKGTFGENISKSFYDQGRTATFSQNVGDFFKSAPKAPTDFSKEFPKVGPESDVFQGPALDPVALDSVGSNFQQASLTHQPSFSEWARNQPGFSMNDSGQEFLNGKLIPSDLRDRTVWGQPKGPGNLQASLKQTFVPSKDLVAGEGGFGSLTPAEMGQGAAYMPPGYNPVAGTEKSFLDTASDFFFPKDASQSVIDKKAAGLIRKHPTLYGGKGGVDRAGAAAKAELNPGVVRKGVGPVAGGLGVAGALGAFKTKKVEQPEERGPYVNPEWDLAREEGESDADYDARKKEHRRKYVLSDEALDPTLYTKPPYVIPPYQPYHQRRQQRRQQRMFGADGGMAAYPRRELLVEGPGTERSDDIPAMLSDGEFVWNAKAVRGADPSGRGDRYAGARNLYDMMRNFEMKS